MPTASAGRDSRATGDRRGLAWMIGIRDPRRPGEVAAMPPWTSTTSGDDERFDLDGMVFTT